MEDKLRELYEQVRIQERNKMFLALEEDTKYTSNETAKYNIKVKFLTNEFSKFENKYNTGTYRQIKLFSDGFNLAIEQYGKLELSEIIQKSKEYYLNNIHELNSTDTINEKSLDLTDVTLVYELSYYNAWVEMSEARILKIDDQDTNYFDLGDYLHNDTALPTQTEIFEPCDLLKIINNRISSEQELLLEINRQVNTRDLNRFMPLYSKLHSILSNCNNGFHKPLINEIETINFNANLSGISTAKKINWDEMLYVLIYLLDSLARESLLKNECIDYDDRNQKIASNNFIMAHFKFKDKAIINQSINNTRIETETIRIRKIDKKIKMINQIIKYSITV